MKNKFYEIQTPKQDNGVWGIPLSCRRIDKAIPMSDENHLKHSAFLIAVSEIHKQDFEVCLSNKNGFAIRLYGDGDKKYIGFIYEHYKIEDSKIIYLK